MSAISKRIIVTVSANPRTGIRSTGYEATLYERTNKREIISENLES